ncbi:MAG TPA: tubulin-like doman-containing protein [Pirellulales bacterium]
MSTILPESAFNRAEPIPGYRTQERLGAGGYGEVWKAEAPGGIAKAIKIVYGWHDGDRALRELSSLNRIKEVRHPFLLSLERIELIDGHLVIVAELANSSLKNAFDEYREAGHSGIPRDELLTHLRDAADALDYICEKHSLQHLDVKPENLLLVGGRVKVADFGLVKDLQEVNCSLVGGLTPVYAAPELFDGRPNLRSDQYSLAIVYQEMLTGMLPFSGRTTAQLAAQHLHSRPRLDRLPAWDQATIAKALSKDANQRFQNCREMVDSLLAAGLGSRSRSASPAGARGVLPTAMPAMQTEMLAWDEGPLGGARSSRPSPQILAPAPAVVNLPPLEAAPETTTFRPTIFVGVGGLAARTLQLLQRRLTDRFGDLRAVPALQMILLETDSEALKLATAQDNPASLNNDAALLLRLRQPADYRREPGRHQKWLSRRWIFNIPRSLQTQGFRPLGRLALVDHSERVIERLRRTISAAVQPEAIAASSQQTGLPFRAETPRVFVVSSMTGGAGSGMVFDIAYLVRHVLRDLKLSDEDVCGILAHCTAHQTQGHDIAVANSYACLTELNHYSDLRSACPADPEGGLPACNPQVAPFSHAYVVHLGEGLDPQHFAAAADNLAAYLYCNSVTSAAAFFDSCRGRPASGETSASCQPTVRTFGISQLGLCHDDVPIAAVSDLCSMLIKRWREPESAGLQEPQPTSLADPSSLLVQQFISSATDDQMRAEVIERTQSAGLADIKPLIDQFYNRATEAMGSDPDSYLAKVLQELVNKSDSRGGLWNRLPDAESIIDSLDRLIRSQGLQNSPSSCLELVLEAHLTEFAAARATALCQWILSLVSLPQCRLAGAQRAAEYLTQQLQPLSRQASARLQSRRQELVAREQTLRHATGAGAKWLKFRGFGPRRRLVVDERLSQYFQLRIEDLILNGICRLIGLILADVAALDDKLRNLAADLNRLAEEFQRLPALQPTSGAVTAADSSEKVRELVTRTVGSQKARLIAEMERELEPELLRIFQMEEGEVRSRLPRVMVRAAHATILRALQGASLLELVQASPVAAADSRFAFGAGLTSAEPKLSQCGGARRLLVIAPAGFPASELTAQSSQQSTASPTIVADGGQDVIVCYEAEHLSLPHVAAAVLDQRLQYVEVASRLQTRADVTWTPL